MKRISSGKSSFVFISTKTQENLSRAFWRVALSSLITLPTVPAIFLRLPSPIYSTFNFGSLIKTGMVDRLSLSVDISGVYGVITNGLLSNSTPFDS